VPVQAWQGGQRWSLARHCPLLQVPQSPGQSIAVQQSWQLPWQQKGAVWGQTFPQRPQWKAALRVLVQAPPQQVASVGAQRGSMPSSGLGTQVEWASQSWHAPQSVKSQHSTQRPRQQTNPEQSRLEVQWRRGRGSGG
jgi:hypothetical protein